MRNGHRLEETKEKTKMRHGFSDRKDIGGKW